MKVRYRVVTRIDIDKDIKYTIEYAIGEVAGFIPGNKDNPDKFLIADDKSGTFIKVNVSECYKVD